MKLSVFDFSASLWTVALLVAAPSALAAQQDPPKKTGVEITEMETSFDEGAIRFEGSVTAHRKKPIPGLVMQLEFFDSTGALLNILNQTIEEDAVERGDGIEFYLVCDEVPRAVSFRVVMFSGRGTRLRTSQAGPYPL